MSDKETIEERVKRYAKFRVGCVKHNKKHEMNYDSEHKDFRTSCGEVFTVAEWDKALHATGWRPSDEEAFRKEQKLKIKLKEAKGKGVTYGVLSIIFGFIGMFFGIPLLFGAIGLIVAFRSVEKDTLSGNLLALVGALISMYDVWYGITTLGMILDMLSRMG